jgi:hypothetical protein
MSPRLIVIPLIAFAASWLFSTVSHAGSGATYRTDHASTPAVSTTNTTSTTSTFTATHARVQYALDQVGNVEDGPVIPWTDTWSGYCEAFVIATVHAGEGDTTPLSSSDVFRNAAAHYQWSLDHGYIHTTTSPPPGALVFYDTGAPDGHVAISVGEGVIVTTQGNAGDDYAVVTAHYTDIPGYLGWSWF